MFFKTIFKDSIKLKELEIMHKNGIYTCISWYSKSLLIFGEKNPDVSRTRGMCHMIHMFFGYFLGKV